MKKIYSILLMAVALLISTNLKAEYTVNSGATTVSSYADLRDALNDASVSVITLGTDLTDLTKYQLFYVNRAAGSVVTLNLNGKNIANDNLEKALFNIYRGTLKITGSGRISTAKSGNFGSAQIMFAVMGTPDPTIADYSGLEIGEGVEVLNNNTAGGETNKQHGCGIVIRESNSFSQVYAGTSTPITIPEFHNTYITYNKSDATTAQANLCYGVKVVVKGKVTAPKYGIKVNGLIKSAVELRQEGGTNYTFNGAQHTLNADCDAHLPILEIGPNAKIRSHEQSGNSTAVYCAGVSNTAISGDIAGATGVYIKSGNITIDDAKIASTATTYTAVENDRKSGIEAQGSAIVIESSASYSGHTNVTVTGDTEVTAVAGYAIDEKITQASGDTKVSAIEIESGSFQGGNQTPTEGGVMQFQNGTNQNGDIIITGGNISGDVAIGEATGMLQTIVNSSVDEGDAVVTPVVTEEGTTYVINTIDKAFTPTPEDVVFDITSAAGENVNFGSMSATALGEANYTITSPLTLGTVMMTSATPTTITIDGTTLTIDQLTMNKDAKIIVNDDATLIVNGAQGFNTFSVNNIILKSSVEEVVDGDNTYSIVHQGKMLFNPAVESGRHPKATVQMQASSYRMADGVTYVIQYFGHPMYNGALTSITATPADRVASFYAWNQNAWESAGSVNWAGHDLILSKFNQDFGFYSIQSNNLKENPITLEFKGEINGNNDVEGIQVLNAFTTLSNGYLSDIHAKSISAALNEIIGSRSVYVCRLENNHLRWEAKQPGLGANVLSDLTPMQPFMIENRTGSLQTLTLNYNNLVWSAPASAPERQLSDLTQATIYMEGAGMHDYVVVAQSDNFATDDSYNASKYMSEGANLYVSAENKMNIYAAQDLNHTLIGYNTIKAGMYTMTFAGVEGKNLVLVDLANGAQINIEEGATYTFAASANETNDARFEIVEARKMPTDVEVVDAATKAQKGIYNLVGAYLGEDFDVLPAGIYVVNGVKVVK